MPLSRRAGAIFSRVSVIVFIGATFNGSLFSVFSDVFISPAPASLRNGSVCMRRVTPAQRYSNEYI